MFQDIKFQNLNFGQTSILTNFFANFCLFGASSTAYKLLSGQATFIWQPQSMTEKGLSVIHYVLAISARDTFCEKSLFQNSPQCWPRLYMICVVV